MNNDISVIKMKGSGKILFEPKPYSNKQLRHKKDNIHAALLMINDDMCEYYSWFFEKRFGLKLLKPARKSHITFINDKIVDFELFNKIKEKWHGKEIEFLYKPTQLRNENKSWWIRCECPELDQIRAELGLGKYKFGYHITIGNIQELVKDQFIWAKKYNILYEKD